MKTGTKEWPTGYGQGAWKGIYSDSNLSSSQIAAAVKKQLLKEFPESKFSVRKESYAGGWSLYVTLMAAPFQAVLAGSEWSVKYQTEQVSEHHMEEYSAEYCEKFPRSEEQTRMYGPARILHTEAIKQLKRAIAIANSFNYDESDCQSDYFHCGFYLTVGIGGGSEKPFINTKK